MTRITLTRSAKQELFRLNGAAQRGAADLLDRLGAEPFRPGPLQAWRLHGAAWSWVVALGEYRLVFFLEDDELVLTRVAPQKELYKI